MYTNVTVGFRESYCLSGFYEYLSLNSIGSAISHYLLNMPPCGMIIDILINNNAANPKLVKVAAHKSEGFRKFAQIEKISKIRKISRIQTWKEKTYENIIYYKFYNI